MVNTDALLHPRTLNTARLRLEPLGLRHLEHVMQTLEHQEFMRLTGTHVHYTRFEVQRLLSTLPRRNDRADWAIVRRSDSEYVGEVVLNELDVFNHSMNFRILLATPDLVGQGYGTEATNAAVQYGFQVVGLHRIRLGVYAFNPRARRVYEKAGFAAWFVRDGGEHGPQWVMRKVIRAGPGHQEWNTATERENGTFLDSAQGCLEGGVQGVRRAF